VIEMVDFHTGSHESNLHQVAGADNNGNITGSAKEIYDNLTGSVQISLKTAEQSVASNFGTLTIDGIGGTAGNGSTTGSGPQSAEHGSTTGPEQQSPDHGSTTGPEQQSTVQGSETGPSHQPIDQKPSDFSVTSPSADHAPPASNSANPGDSATGKGASIPNLPHMELRMNDN
jgi:hypothetical protein